MGVTPASGGLTKLIPKSDAIWYGLTGPKRRSILDAKWYGLTKLILDFNNQANAGGKGER